MGRLPNRGRGFIIADFHVAAIRENENHKRMASCGKVSMACEERLLSLRGLKKDYFKSGKLMKNTIFFSLSFQWGKRS